MRAFCLIRDAPWYRRGAFVAGLRAAGHEPLLREPDRFDRDTLLVIWNRYGRGHELALMTERGGGRVLVAENGYLGAGGSSPKFDVHPGGPESYHYYALAEGWHNGGGRWPAGGPERWDALKIEFQEWRRVDGHVLVCPNRSFGVAGRMMAPDWAEDCAKRLRKDTRREVRIRPHPGNDAPRRPLDEDLRGAWAVVIWSSNAGLHALTAGLPVLCKAPHWVAKGAAAYGSIETLTVPDPLPELRRVAWAQWRLDEIETGEPFAHLLSAAR